MGMWDDIAHVWWSEDNIKDYPYLVTEEETKPENCRNCGSAHTRIKKGVTVCAYCGSRSE